MVDSTHNMVWRYIDLVKFVDLIQTSELFFPSIASFRKTDRFEGEFPKKWLTQEVVHGADEDDHRSRVESFGRMRDIVGNYLVNCWHENNSESAAMWKLYLKSDEGIAIRSTYGKLERLMYHAQPSVALRRVFYVDYTKAIPFDPYNADNWVTHKRKSFEHEREARGIIYEYEMPGVAAKTHARVKFPLDELIDHVAVAPGASDLLLSVVEKLVKDSTFSKATVHRSAMDDLP